MTKKGENMNDEEMREQIAGPNWTVRDMTEEEIRTQTIEGLNERITALEQAHCKHEMTEYRYEVDGEFIRQVKMCGACGKVLSEDRKLLDDGFTEDDR